MEVGVQGRADDSYETARKYVQDGTLGKVVLAQIDYSRNYKGDFWEYPMDADVKPGVNLDWKAWLGSARGRRPQLWGLGGVPKLLDLATTYGDRVTASLPNRCAGPEQPR